jgi:hypothetical protein
VDLLWLLLTSAESSPYLPFNDFRVLKSRPLGSVWSCGRDYSPLRLSCVRELCQRRYIVLHCRMFAQARVASERRASYAASLCLGRPPRFPFSRDALALAAFRAEPTDKFACPPEIASSNSCDQSCARTRLWPSCYLATLRSKAPCYLEIEVDDALGMAEQTEV